VEIKKKPVIVDDCKGKPNFMTLFYISKEPQEEVKLEDVPEMFRVNGRVVAGVAISQFTNKVIGGLPYSLPFQQPEENVNHEEAMKMCRRKGKGWHLLTNAEWMYLIGDAAAAGHEIYGNTNYGKDADHPESEGWCYDGYTTLTGTDPREWSHDGTINGVYGLKGNFWEHVCGLRLKKGNIEYIPDNNAAEVEDDRDPGVWTAAQIGEETLRMEGTEDGVRLTTKKENSRWNACHFRELEVDLPGGEVPEILHRLGVVPENWKEEKAGIWVDSSIESVPYRGSGFLGTSYGGPAALDLYDPRTGSLSSISFRSALILENWELITEKLIGV
jgi:hypothetical protein